MYRKMLGALVACVLCAGAAGAQAAAALVQTVASPFAAHAGGSGVSVGNSAIILVQVNNRISGAPEAALGASVGNGTAAIALPAALSIFSNAPVPAGGCLLTPTEFTNWGGGAYTIRVVPFAANPACKWGAGTYAYVVNVSTGTLKGAGVGSFVVP